MRIVSFLPSATEMVYALGLGDQLVGVTHECDYPSDVRTKPVVVRSSIDMKGLSSQQIDEAVSRALKAGQSLYAVDEVLLSKLAPDLILTQDLCQVCAPSGNEVGRVLELLPEAPQILFLTPTCLSEIFDNIQQVGEVTGKVSQAVRFIQGLKERVRAVSDQTRHLTSRPRVFCMEWLHPPYNAGHWMAEIIDLAGGRDDLAQKGRDSVRIAWERILEYQPEILILSPCGFDLEEVLRQMSLLTTYPDWQTLPAVMEGRVYAVDANRYFARPGPRIVDGLELLAALFHPDQLGWTGSTEAYRSLGLKEIQALSGQM